VKHFDQLEKLDVEFRVEQDEEAEFEKFWNLTLPTFCLFDKLSPVFKCLKLDCGSQGKTKGILNDVHMLSEFNCVNI
jgi:hypothetical protein